MPPSEHVHIISAGENIHAEYPAIFRSLPTIPRTFVLADNTVYELSSNPEVEKERLAVRDAVAAVKEISTSLSIPFSRELVFPPVYPSVRDTLTKIHRGFPGARYTFDLSGGSKPLCRVLFAFSSWLDGEVYSAFDEKTPRSVPLPRPFGADPARQSQLPDDPRHPSPDRQERCRDYFSGMGVPAIYFRFFSDFRKLIHINKFSHYQGL